MWSESQGASGTICGGKGEKPRHTLGWPQTQPRAKARPTTPPHWRKRSTFSTLQSQLSGKKLRTGMSSSSIRSSSRRASRAGGPQWEGMKRGTILPFQRLLPVPQPHPEPHLGQGPPGPWSGTSCAGPQQTGSRIGRAPGRPAAAPEPPAARRSVSWAASSAHPGSSAWLLGKHTGPLQGQVRVRTGKPTETHLISHPDL